jgi:maltose alpha-D-glucosyltransferase/alpha-amylase
LEQWYLASATILGRRTAEFHLALANSADPAFAPEPITTSGLAELAESMRAGTGAALDLLRTRLDSLPDATRPQADEVLASRELFERQFEAVATIPDGGLRIRVHGDYHLGQVLRTEEDFVILDFEGEPARSLAERRAKVSPLKDVSGMIRSFGYAAYAALFAFIVHAPDELSTLEPWANTWRRWVSRAFLGGYRQLMMSTPSAQLLPQGESFERLLRAFVLEKALYELAYELNNRPEWVRIPLAGILQLR